MISLTIRISIWRSSNYPLQWKNETSHTFTRVASTSLLDLLATLVNEHLPLFSFARKDKNRIISQIISKILLWFVFFERIKQILQQA
jgi:hypothetical protein